MQFRGNIDTMDGKITDDRDDDTDQVAGHGTELSFFVDLDTVLAFIRDICYDDWELPFQDRYEWVVATLGKYQEQPTLLDPHLCEMLAPLMDRMIVIATNSTLDTSRTSTIEVGFFFIFDTSFSPFECRKELDTC